MAPACLVTLCWAVSSVSVTLVSSMHGSHFGSRYKLGCCGHAGLFCRGSEAYVCVRPAACGNGKIPARVFVYARAVVPDQLITYLTVRWPRAPRPVELPWARASGSEKGWSGAPSVRSRGNCISFWPSIPPLQVVPSFACSVASLSHTQVISHQELATYMMSSLWAICLVGVSHPHDLQHMK